MAGPCWALLLVSLLALRLADGRLTQFPRFLRVETQEDGDDVGALNGKKAMVWCDACPKPPDVDSNEAVTGNAKAYFCKFSQEDTDLDASQRKAEGVVPCRKCEEGPAVDNCKECRKEQRVPGECAACNADACMVEETGQCDSCDPSKRKKKEEGGGEKKGGEEASGGDEKHVEEYVLDSPSDKTLVSVEKSLNKVLKDSGAKK